MGEIVVKIGKDQIFYTLAIIAIILSIIKTFNVFFNVIKVIGAKPYSVFEQILYLIRINK
jgi:hypothetical protein